jgi:hypothetical protein
MLAVQTCCSRRGAADAQAVDPGTRRKTTIGDWTIVLPASFEEVHNSDSWQAVSGSRVVYVSSNIFNGGNKKPLPPDEFLALMKHLADEVGGERISFSDADVHGEAGILGDASGWTLKGNTWIGDRLATCVIDFADEGDKEWAVSTWKSIRRQ